MFAPKCISDRRPFRIERRLTSRGRTLQSISAPQLVGASSQFNAVVQQIEKIGHSAAGVLIHGETGSGKELAARAIHWLSDRRGGPFVAVNCGAVPDGLVETELFGHGKGAFTDAREAREGVIAQADGGTLFLDETDTLSPKAQVSLLRFLQDLRYRAVGTTTEIASDVRIMLPPTRTCTAGRRWAVQEGSAVSAEHLRALDPAASQPAGRHRAARAAFHPPVQRQVRHLAQTVAPDHAGVAPAPRLAGQRSRARELDPPRAAAGRRRRNPQRSAVRTDGPSKRGRQRIRGLADGQGTGTRRVRNAYVATVLADAHGNVTAAARLAGKERRAFGKLLKKYGIDRGRYQH